MIARTNLLPWRQRRRDRQRRAFVAQLCLVFAGAACLVVLAVVLLDGRVDMQDARNRFLIASIGELERDADEIETIRRRTEETLGRVQTLSSLRRDRTSTVRIFEELARTIAPGIHYTSLVMRGTHITAQGIARSNNDVSALMRSLQESERFEAPRLKGIEETRGNGGTEPAAAFELAFSTPVPFPQVHGR